MNETLKDLRRSAKKSVGEVAEALGVTERAVYNYERGIREVDIKSVLVLADLYGVTAEEVINAQLNSR